MIALPFSSCVLAVGVALVMLVGCGPPANAKINVFSIAGSPTKPCLNPFYVLTTDDGRDHIRYVVVQPRMPEDNPWGKTDWLPHWNVGEQFDYINLQPNTIATIHDKSIDKDFTVSVAYVVDLDLGGAAAEGANERANSLCQSP